MARNFGQVMGVALAAAILSHGLHADGVAGLAPGSNGVAEGSYLIAYVESQAMAYRVAAALGLVGAVLSALRGAEAPHTPAARPEMPDQGEREESTSQPHAAASASPTL